jgi:CubicO group peptidase (beta-lactamase class C family)
MRFFLAAVLIALPGPALCASPSPLGEYEGHYEYRDGLSVYMVAQGEQLVAIIDQSKYLLRRAGPDKFLNPAGDAIPFHRDAGRRVVAFEEYSQRFARLSSDVPKSARMLLQPRAPGPDGLPIIYRYQAPPRLEDGIEVGQPGPGPGTVPREVAERLVNEVIDGRSADVRSLLVWHQGRLVIEEYFYGFDRDRPHGMRSFSKSVISLLVGAAIDRGLLRDDEPTLARLGLPPPRNPDPRKSRITVSQLLSNQSGLACNEHDQGSPGSEIRLFETDDWVRTFFDLPMLDDPGTVARYCSGGFFAAGRLVERSAGKPLPEFAREVLFGPLGISRDHWSWNFTLDRSQRNQFGQVHLTPRAMLKLGILIRDRGLWQGRRVISASWIDAAISRRSRVDDSDYGLGIWHRWFEVATANGPHRIDTLMLSGNGGQKVYLVPSLDLIVVSTGSAYFVDSPLNRMMVQHILPALMSGPVR